MNPTAVKVRQAQNKGLALSIPQPQPKPVATTVNFSEKLESGVDWDVRLVVPVKPTIGKRK